MTTRFARRRHRTSHQVERIQPQARQGRTALTSSSLFTRERVRNYSAIFVVMGLAGLAVAVLLGDFPLVVRGQPFTPDFVAHWTGAKMLLDGASGDLYNPAYQAWLQHQ